MRMAQRQLHSCDRFTGSINQFYCLVIQRRKADSSDTEDSSIKKQRTTKKLSEDFIDDSESEATATIIHNNVYVEIPWRIQDDNIEGTSFRSNDTVSTDNTQSTLGLSDNDVIQPAENVLEPISSSEVKESNV